MTLMAQREFYFANEFSLSGGKFILRPEFYDFVAIHLFGRKDYFLIRPICSCGYSLKEQTWLAIYERGYPRKFLKEVTPVKRKSNPPFYPDLQRYF